MTKLLSSKIGISCYSLSLQHVRLHINGPGRTLALRYYELSLFSTPLDAVTGRYFVWGFQFPLFKPPSLLYTLLLLLLLRRAWSLIFLRQRQSLFVYCRSFCKLFQTYQAKPRLSLPSSRLTG